MGFRKDFVWGVATAAYQVEGAAREDGRGPSIWDDFSHTPGRVRLGHTGDTACDHYHRFREDVALMRTLGVRHYRFSFSWPRLLPEGTGAPNEAGLRFYDALIDCLLENGIQPLATLYHWDLPSALHRRGGWLNPESPAWFAQYAELVARRYGDRVRDFFTFNEPQCVIGLGYVLGDMAPGLRMGAVDTIPMSHHIHVAHGLAAQRLRALVPGVRIGFVGCGPVPLPATDAPADQEAARQEMFAVSGREVDRWAFSTAWWHDPVLLGRYPEDGLRLYGQYLPKGFEKQLETIAQPVDYVAQNLYEGRTVRAGESGAAEEVPFLPGAPRTACDWPITPETLYWGPRFLWERYRRPVFITENGMSGHDAVSLDGKVHDPYRIDYLQRYLRALRRAAEDGVEVYGYLAWSLLDNFEWHQGYEERFGLVHVDYETFKRTVKDSALWYRDVMAANGENL